MKPRPTKKNLRAGKLLFVIDLKRGLAENRIQLGGLYLDNKHCRALRRFPERFPWALAFYSRRQAISHAHRLLDAADAVGRDFRAGIKSPYAPWFLILALVDIELMGENFDEVKS